MSEYENMTVEELTQLIRDLDKERMAARNKALEVIRVRDAKRVALGQIKAATAADQTVAPVGIKSGESFGTSQKPVQMVIVNLEDLKKEYGDKGLFKRIIAAVKSKLG